MPFERVPLKFRHIYGEPYKKEFWYENVPISRNAHDGSFIACNPKFLAVAAESSGGGVFVVLPTVKAGRISEMNLPRVCGHKGAVLDLQWNPFDDHIVSSASDDCLIKLWRIPEEGLLHDLTESVVDLESHRRRVLYTQWHPSAAHIMASAAYDHKVLIWDIEHQSVVTDISAHSDQILSLVWNWTGSLLATTSKDKNLRLLDPRTGGVVHKVKCHQGPKGSKAIFLEDELLATIGFGMNGEREFAVWNTGGFDRTVQRSDIDQSSGVILPYYDTDCSILYLAGKGDGNIRYYELSQGELHYLNQYTSNTPQRGLGMMPKRDMDQDKCEVTRFYKLHVTHPIVEPLSLIAPRRGGFREDLYPPTRSPFPALSAQDWIEGMNDEPVLYDPKTGHMVNPPEIAVRVPILKSIKPPSPIFEPFTAPLQSPQRPSPIATSSPVVNTSENTVPVVMRNSTNIPTNGQHRPRSTCEIDLSAKTGFTTSSPTRGQVTPNTEAIPVSIPDTVSNEVDENKKKEEKKETIFDKNKFKNLVSNFERKPSARSYVSPDDSQIGGASFNRFSRKSQSVRERSTNVWGGKTVGSIAAGVRPIQETPETVVGAISVAEKAANWMSRSATNESEDTEISVAVTPEPETTPITPSKPPTPRIRKKVRHTIDGVGSRYITRPDSFQSPEDQEKSIRLSLSASKTSTSRPESVDEANEREVAREIVNPLPEPIISGVSVKDRILEAETKAVDSTPVLQFMPPRRSRSATLPVGNFHLRSSNLSAVPEVSAASCPPSDLSELRNGFMRQQREIADLRRQLEEKNTEIERLRHQLESALNGRVNGKANSNMADNHRLSNPIATKAGCPLAAFDDDESGC